MRIKRVLESVLASALVLTMLSGCGIGNSKIELKYDAQINDDNSYNTSLFYRNDLVVPVADPAVIQITDKNNEEYGYYYLYGTNSTRSFIAYRSKDLQSWENVSDIKGFNVFYPADNSFCFDTLWAPEVIYDPNDGKYYMYYSGRNELINDTWTVMIGLAVSDQPYGPFVAYEDETHDASTPLFDRDKMMETVEAKGGMLSEHWTCIDPHPFFAPDGSKYLYFTRDHAGDNPNTMVWGIKMNDWGKPDYSTLTQLTKTGYYTVDGNEIADYEGTVNRINEGAHTYIKKQPDGSYKYYLTLSINGYRDKSYSVIQAVSDSPLGPYRKLTEEEGGILISTDHMSWDHISGPGHHCFITAGDELYIMYHAHIDRQLGGSARAIAIDRVLFTENEKGDEVMYANGPTWSLQPEPNAFAEYTNIAGEAKVKANRGENVEALTDGLLSLYRNIPYVKEFETKKTTTITLDFGDYREITGLMVYNSKFYEKAFPEITNIEFDFKNDEVKKGGTAYIKNLQFDWNNYKNPYSENMRPGGSAVAIFNPLLVKKIRITFKLPMSRPEEIELLDEDGYVQDQAEIALSEIVVLGKQKGD